MVRNSTLMFYARPSKNFFFRRLEKELAKERGGLALDAASAAMKNRPMFKTAGYVGLDRDEAALRRGLEMYRSTDTLGLLCDLTKLSALPEGVFDLIASTNTLDHLKPAEAEQAVRNFIRLLKPRGTLLCQMSISARTDAIAAALRKEFQSVKTIYYTNPFSAAYEKLFETEEGELGYHPFASSRPMRFFSFVISLLEYPISLFAILNRQVFFVCRGKKGGAVSVFDPAKLLPLGDRLYRCS